MSVIRAATFYVGYALITIIWGSLGVLFGWILPFRARFAFIIGGWTRICLFWLRLCCGISAQISGLENLPKKPCIVLSRHESTWETLFLQTLLAPQATLIKRELLWIPFFGWAFRLLKPIAIDRSDGRKALRQLVSEGKARLDAGFWVVLFPEGTRLAHAQTGKLQPGGAALAAASGAPIVIFAHDAGRYWPAHAFLKSPGVVQGSFSTPIMTAGMTSKAIQAMVSDELDRMMASLSCPSL
ncbi:MAG: lysophospholipid acyltransferase family protein [Pseudomonadales bacterium]